MIAFSKPDGGVRGIVAGNVVCRLVTRTMAQQLGKAVEAATAPHQALSEHDLPSVMCSRGLRGRRICVVWRGSDFPFEQQGLKVLGSLLGYPAHIQKFLEKALV